MKKIKISFIGIAILTLLLIYDASGNAVISVFAALVHESGHLLAILIMRDSAERISIGLYGMRIDKSQTTGISYAKECVITLAGPVFSLLTAAVSAFLSLRFTAANLIIGLFNLLPMLPFDGGFFLYYIICIRRNSEDSGRIMKKITVIGTVPLTVMGIILAFNGNYSLLAAAAYVLLSLSSLSRI